MSKQLIDSIERFLKGETPVNEFVNCYIEAWREERDSGVLLADDPAISEKLSSTFCLADMYNPNDDREHYELDESRLRDQISNVFYK